MSRLRASSAESCWENARSVAEALECVKASTTVGQRVVIPLHAARHINHRHDPDPSRRWNYHTSEETMQEDLRPLPSKSADRKAVPVVTGVWDYFPAALAEVARVSKAGNDKHNPGEPLHHARGKSTDHADSIGRHLMERGGIDPDTGVRHSAELAWRALALLQQELEDEGLAPMARGATPPVGEDRYGRPGAFRAEHHDAEQHTGMPANWERTSA